MKEYLEQLLSTVTESVLSMDLESYQKIISNSVETLNNGGRIIVTGLGKNVPVCEKFVGTMNSLGLNSSFMNTNSAVHGDLGMVDQKDLVIVMTKSGETIESIYLTTLLKERKCCIWLLSFNDKSTLTKEIPNGLILKLSHEGDLWDIIPNNSTTVNLIVLQSVAINIAKELNVDLETFKVNHPGGYIGEKLRDNEK